MFYQNKDEKLFIIATGNRAYTDNDNLEHSEAVYLGKSSDGKYYLINSGVDLQTEPQTEPNLN
jgi:hypothetical protein